MGRLQLLVQMEGMAEMTRSQAGIKSRPLLLKTLGQHFPSTRFTTKFVLKDISWYQKKAEAF
jgi:hypothetical protein